MPHATPARSATVCPDLPLLFENLGCRQVVVDFSGGTLSTDGGALLLRAVDRGLGLTAQLAQAFTDRRDARYCDHSLHHLLSQRLYGNALGYDDLNDHDTLPLGDIPQGWEVKKLGEIAEDMRSTTIKFPCQRQL